MKAEAMQASQALVADEAALDKLFIDRRADLASITSASRKAALSEAAVQVIHLKYHLAMRDLLTPEQIAAYSAMGSHPEQAGPESGAHHHTPGMLHPDQPHGR